MMKTKQKEDNVRKLLMDSGNKDDDIEEEIQVKGKILKIHNEEVQDEITTDLRLARFDSEKDRKFILELASIAGDCKNTVEKYYRDIENYLLLIYKKLPKNWIEQKKLRVSRNKDMFMRRIAWLSNLNINTANNYLIKDLLQSPTVDDGQVMDDNQLSRDLKDLKNSFANQEVRGQ